MLIAETTVNDLISQAEPEPWKTTIEYRAKPFRCILRTVKLNQMENKCEVQFVLSAEGHHTELVKINLLDFWETYSYLVDKTYFYRAIRQAVNLAVMEGNIRVYCPCEAYRYGGYKYMATQLDYNYKSGENRFPKKRNPNLLGTVCKHIYVALKAIKFNQISIANIIYRKLGDGR